MMCGNVFYDVLPPNPYPECNSPSSSSSEITKEEYDKSVKEK